MLARSLMDGFALFVVAQFPLSQNRIVDAHVNLASNALYPFYVVFNIMTHLCIHNAAVHTTKNRVGNYWITPISNYLRSKALPKNRSEVVKVKAQAIKYALRNDTLYMR